MQFECPRRLGYQRGRAPAAAFGQPKCHVLPGFVRYGEVQKDSGRIGGKVKIKDA